MAFDGGHQILSLPKLNLECVDITSLGESPVDQDWHTIKLLGLYMIIVRLLLANLRHSADQEWSKSACAFVIVNPEKPHARDRVGGDPCEELAFL